MCASIAAMLCQPSRAVAQPSASDAAVILASNAGLSAVSSGLVALLQGRPVWRAVLGGGLGGGVSGAGKLVISSAMPGGGFLGRELAGVGASITRNAMVGSSLLDTLTVPLGPLRASVSVGGRAVTAVRIDLDQLAWAAYGFLSSRYALDWQLTVEAGAFVFVSPDNLPSEDPNLIVGGRAGPGSVFLSSIQLGGNDRLLAHELAHVVQIDQLKTVYGDPLERVFIRAVAPRGAAPFKYVELGVAHYPFTFALRPIFELESDVIYGR